MTCFARLVLRLALTALILVPPDGATAQTPQFESATADVVGWNLSGFLPIPHERVDEIVQVLLDLDAEVVALAEINPDEVLADIASEATEAGVCYNAVLLDQTAGQNLGVRFKCGIEVTNARLVPDTDDGNSSLRRALAVDVRLGEFDFVLVTLHLKAGRATSDRETRNRQAEALATFVASATSGGEQDILIVGDYNMIRVEDTSNFVAMNPTNALRFVSTDDLAGQFSHLSGAGCSGGNLLDGFAVSRTGTVEYIEGSLRIYPMQRALGLSLCDFRDEVSDHLPLIARFRIGEDDDVDAPGGDTTANVLITAVLPNPMGIDHNAEQVTIRNDGASDLSLAGWTISDDDGNEFGLSGVIAAGTAVTVTILRPAMLNNDGDVVRVSSPDGLVSSVSYSGTVASGQALVCDVSGVCG